MNFNLTKKDQRKSHDYLCNSNLKYTQKKKLLAESKFKDRKGKYTLIEILLFTWDSSASVMD